MVIREYIEEIHFVQKNYWLIFSCILQYSVYIILMSASISLFEHTISNLKLLGHSTFSHLLL